MLKLTGVGKSFGSQRVLDDVSLEVPPGVIFGLIGPDGGGKTTLMRIACGLLLADDGAVSLSGYDPVRQPRRVKERLGYMPQRFSLYPDLTVAENIRFFADLYAVPRGEFRPRLERLLAFSRLAPFQKRRAGRLSGGMKQKLALCCTLIHTPQVLILDEPTTGVDPVSRGEFWRLLRELAADGLALLVSTPYMDEAPLCDRVALVHRGRVIAAGRPTEITSRFPGLILRLRGADLAAARERIIRLGDVDVHRFGDALHISMRDEGDRRRVERAVASLSLEVSAVEPDIEDFFMALISDDTADVGDWL